MLYWSLRVAWNTWPSAVSVVSQLAGADVYNLQLVLCVCGRHVKNQLMRSPVLPFSVSLLQFIVSLDSISVSPLLGRFGYSRRFCEFFLWPPLPPRCFWYSVRSRPSSVCTTDSKTAMRQVAAACSCGRGPVGKIRKCSGKRPKPASEAVGSKLIDCSDTASHI